MATEVGVANAALRRLGANIIASFTEGTKSANCATEFYEETRDGLLRVHNWNFATKRVKLAQLATAPVFGYDHSYALPADSGLRISRGRDHSGLLVCRCARSTGRLT